MHVTKIGSTAAGGQDLSNNTQIRLIGLMEPEICTKMLKRLSEKLRAKFPATTCGYSMVKIACLNDAFLKVFFLNLQASPVEGQSLLQKEKRTKRKGEKINQKSKSLKT